MKSLLYTVAVVVTIAPCAALAQDAKPELTVTPDGIAADGYFDNDYAFCIPAATGHVKAGPDKSLGVSWSKGPEGTKSYALVMVDTDVPTDFTDAGKEGKVLPADMERRSFYHWVLYDIPADTVQIPATTDSNGIVQHGKAELKTPYGTRGINDYGPYFASDPARKGIYAGYDGPCPPWNDARIHHYHVKVFALDVKSASLTGAVAGPQLMDAIAGHILAQGEIIGKYTLNPEVKK